MFNLLLLIAPECDLSCLSLLKVKYGSLRNQKSSPSKLEQKQTKLRVFFQNPCSDKFFNTFECLFFTFLTAIGDFASVKFQETIKQVYFSKRKTLSNSCFIFEKRSEEFNFKLFSKTGKHLKSLECRNETPICNKYCFEAFYFWLLITSSSSTQVKTLKMRQRSKKVVCFLDWRLLPHRRRKVSHRVF